MAVTENPVFSVGAILGTNKKTGDFLSVFPHFFPVFNFV